METKILVEEVYKTFTLHLQGGIKLNVLKNINLRVSAGECVALSGPSGIGKSTLLRILYANYKPDAGRILVVHQNQWINIAKAKPYQVIKIRQHTIGYVSQFLHVIPRVSALNVVMEPLRRLRFSFEESRSQAEALLRRLNIPRRLWTVSPTTFSGGEKQRINLARSFIYPYPIILLDEPTAALDERNRAVVIELIHEARARGSAIVGVFHDREVREIVATRVFDVATEGIG